MLMEFYEKGIVPDGLQPDWDMWLRRPEASLKQLAFLALNIEPSEPKNYFNTLIKKEEDLECRPNNRASKYFDFYNEPLEAFEHYCEKEEDDLTDIEKNDIVTSDSRIKAYKDLQENLDKSFLDLYNLAYSHLEHGFLRPPIEIDPIRSTTVPDTSIIVRSLYISDFVDWLDSQNIPYPSELKNCLRMRNKPNEEQSELTTAEKSRLQQENNTLKRLFNQMVKLHFNNESPSAYQIAKHISADAKTIRKYLNTKK